MNASTLRKLATAVVLTAGLTAASGAFAIDDLKIIAPAKPGGGFDLTCKLAQTGLLEGRYITAPMRISYLPGGIGAVAFSTVVSQRPADNPDSLTRMQVRMRDGWKLGFHEGADRIDLRFRHDGQVPIAVAKDADQSACGQQFRIAPVVQLLPNE